MGLKRCHVESRVITNYIDIMIYTIIMTFHWMIIATQIHYHPSLVDFNSCQRQGSMFSQKTLNANSFIIAITANLRYYYWVNRLLKLANNIMQTHNIMYQVCSWQLYVIGMKYNPLSYMIHSFYLNLWRLICSSFFESGGILTPSPPISNDYRQTWQLYSAVKQTG